MDYRYSKDEFDEFQGKRLPRLVKKCGELNINTSNVPRRNRRLLSDIFNTILDIKWRWHFVIFVLSFAISWLFFALCWYLLAYFHNDLDYINRAKNSTNIKPCVSGVHDFISALLYSIETQHTIGYGYRHITEDCPFGIFVLMIQSSIGVFVQGLVAGVVFAKLSRPNKRKRTIIFSNNAIVTYRDDKLCFLFKIGNIQTSQLSDARVRLIMIKSRTTKEGEYIPFQSYEMKVGYEWTGDDNIFFPYPKIVEHVIDPSSPLYEISLSNKRAVDEVDDYEIVVILEGNIETTGASCHIRTSYLPNEILWGYRFIPSLPYINNTGYSFDFSLFNQIEPVNSDLFHLNRNKHFSNIFAKIGEKNKEPLSLFSFFKQFNTTSNFNQTITSDTSKSRQSSNNKESQSKMKKKLSLFSKNSRFTIVPVNDINNFQQNNDLTTTSTITHLDEGYLQTS